MYISILLAFLTFLILGIFFNFLLFTKEKSEQKNEKFLSSERFIVFIIEILVAVIGFGVTLSITNSYEHQVKREKAIHMLNQTIEYTDSQISREQAYLVMFDDGEIEGKSLVNASIIVVDYYNNILSNEVVLENASMHTYGEILKYLEWVEQHDKAAKEATEDSKIRSEMYWRYCYLKKARDMMVICSDEISGDISPKEAYEKRKEIKEAKVNGYECIMPYSRD